MGSSNQHAVRFLFCTLFLSLAVGLAVVASARDLISIHLSPALLMIVVFSPTIAAMFLSALGGRRELAALLRPIMRWRVSLWWYATALLLPFVVNAIALAIFAASGQVLPSIPGGPPQQLQALADTSVVLYLNLTVFQLLGSLGEEIGWRGYALPKLQTSNSAIGASLVIAIVWTLWHAPFFLMPDTKQALVPWGWYALYVPAVSILFTCLYNSTRGSLPIVILFHASIQAANVYLPIIEPRGLYALSVLVTLVFSIAVVVVFGHANLSRGTRVTAEPSR